MFQKQQCHKGYGNVPDSKKTKDMELNVWPYTGPSSRNRGDGVRDIIGSTDKIGL